MLIEQALMTFLLAQDGITGYVGDRIYYVQAPQETPQPYMVISKVDGPREHSHDGSSHLAHPRFQLSVFASTYSDAKNCVAALQTALDGYTGTMGGAGGVYVGSSLFDDENDLTWVDDENSGAPGLYGVVADYIIWHEE